MNAARADEPYRRAITGIYARLAATYIRVTGQAPPRPASVDGEAYPDPQSFRLDLLLLEQSLAGESKVDPAGGGGLLRLIRAVETFGFHLATLDLRQNAEVHERVVGELLRVAGVSANYGGLNEADRIALLRRELATERLLSSPYATYTPETASELAIVGAAAQAHRRFGPDCVKSYIVSKCESVSDLLEVNVLLKEAGLYRAQGTAQGAPAAAVMAVPLFETIGDLRRSADIMHSWLHLPEVAAITAAHGWTRRRGRPRRRLVICRNSGAAARQPARPHPHHRTGRDHRRKIRHARRGRGQFGGHLRGDPAGIARTRVPVRDGSPPLLGRHGRTVRRGLEGVSRAGV